MKRLAIVGSHPETRNLVPWDDENFDIWTINEAATMKDSWVKRCTGIFQLHPRNIWDNANNRNDPHHGEWLKANKTSAVFMMEKYDDVPMCEVYPLKEIVEKYVGDFTVFSERARNEFMTCTVSYMAALALWKGYTDVSFYGVELSVDAEYRFQRPGAAFWIGILTQHAKVKFYGKMFDAPLYGYEEEGNVSRDFLVKRAESIRPKRDEEMAKVDPLHQAFEDALKRFADTGVEHENVATTWKAFTAQLNRFGSVDGALQEMEARIKEIDEMIKLDGDYRFSHHGFERKADALQAERIKIALNHAYMSGIIDFLFSQAIAQRLQDSRRQKLLQEFYRQVPEYVKLCQQIGIFAGAESENKILARVIQGKDDNDTSELVRDPAKLS